MQEKKRVKIFHLVHSQKQNYKELISFHIILYSVLYLIPSSQFSSHSTPTFLIQADFYLLHSPKLPVLYLLSIFISMGMECVPQ